MASSPACPGCSDWVRLASIPCGLLRESLGMEGPREPLERVDRTRSGLALHRAYEDEVLFDDRRHVGDGGIGVEHVDAHLAELGIRIIDHLAAFRSRVEDHDIFGLA